MGPVCACSRAAFSGVRNETKARKNEIDLRATPHPLPTQHRRDRIATLPRQCARIESVAFQFHLRPPRARETLNMGRDNRARKREKERMAKIGRE
jgi:hypothetical protein